MTERCQICGGQGTVDTDDSDLLEDVWCPDCTGTGERFLLARELYAGSQASEVALRFCLTPLIQRYQVRQASNDLWTVWDRVGKHFLERRGHTRFFDQDDALEEAERLNAA